MNPLNRYQRNQMHQERAWMLAHPDRRLINRLPDWLRAAVMPLCLLRELVWPDAALARGVNPVQRKIDRLAALAVLAIVVILIAVAARAACAQTPRPLPPLTRNQALIQRVIALEAQLKDLADRVDALELEGAVVQPQAAANQSPKATTGPAPALEPLTADGKPRCQGIVKSKNRQCRLPSEPGKSTCRFHIP